MISSDLQFYVFLFVIFILICVLIATNLRINKLNDKSKKLQKHILYQQGILEKQNKLIGSKTEEQTIQPPPPPTITEEEELPDPPQPVQPQQQIVASTVSHNQQQGPRQNPIANLLPLVSSVMTMMNTTETNPVVINQEPQHMIVEEKTEEEDQLLEEIKTELSELKLNKEKKVSSSEEENVDSSETVTTV